MESTEENIDDSSSQIIIEQQIKKISTLTKIFIRIFVLIVVTLLMYFYLFHQLTKIQSKRKNNSFLSNHLSSKDFTIIIHTSNNTKWRLNKYLNSYIINKNYIHIFVVYTDNVTPDPRFNYIIARGCNDTRKALDCRNTFAYNFFLDNPKLGDFLYRAMDDTYLNITNLEKLISQLRLIYNPTTDVVFRGFANDESPYDKIFLGGGSGWLMSRAMVAVHRIPFYSFQVNQKYAFALQDDTTETIILKKIGFKSLNVWEDLHWAEGGCTSGNFNKYLDGDFNEMEKCPVDKELTPIVDMIAMHSIDEKQKENWLLSKYLPNYIYGYKVPFNQCVRMCKAEPGIVNNRTTFEYLKNNAEYITLDQIKEKSITDFNYNINYFRRKNS